MADKTIATLDTELVSVGANDWIGVWDVAAGQYKKAKRSNVVGATITGAGTLATGGFTLTVPATGTAALLARAQTFTALQTLSAGLTFGGTTLSAYAEGIWSPDLQFGGAKVGLTYSSVVGLYTRIGRLVVANATFTLSAKGSSTGNAIVQDSSGILAGLGTPTTVSTGVINFNNMTTSLVGMQALQIGSAFYMQGLAAAGATVNTLNASDFANNTTIRFTVAYFI